MNFLPGALPAQVLKPKPLGDSVLPRCSWNPYARRVTAQTQLSASPGASGRARSVSVSSTGPGTPSGFSLVRVFPLCPSKGCGLGTQPLRVGSPFI